MALGAERPAAEAELKAVIKAMKVAAKADHDHPLSV
jgi:hypothetical protein